MTVVIIATRCKVLLTSSFCLFSFSSESKLSKFYSIFSFYLSACSLEISPESIFICKQSLKICSIYALFGSIISMFCFVRIGYAISKNFCLANSTSVPLSNSQASKAYLLSGVKTLGFSPLTSPSNPYKP